MEIQVDVWNHTMDHINSNLWKIIRKYISTYLNDLFTLEWFLCYNLFSIPLFDDLKVGRIICSFMPCFNFYEWESLEKSLQNGITSLSKQDSGLCIWSLRVTLKVIPYAFLERQTLYTDNNYKSSSSKTGELSNIDQAVMRVFY